MCQWHIHTITSATQCFCSNWRAIIWCRQHYVRCLIEFLLNCYRVCISPDPYFLDYTPARWFFMLHQPTAIDQRINWIRTHGRTSIYKPSVFFLQAHSLLNLCRFLLLNLSSFCCAPSSTLLDKHVVAAHPFINWVSFSSGVSHSLLSLSHSFLLLNLSFFCYALSCTLLDIVQVCTIWRSLCMWW